MGNQKDLFQQLRIKHTRLVYRGYAAQTKGTDLEIMYDFLLEPDITFHPTVVIHNTSSSRLAHLPFPKIDNYIFHLGLVELLSYWKCACPPEIVIQAGTLSPSQIKWWHDLLISGLGEFFYTNQIDFTKSDLVKFTVANQNTGTFTQKTTDPEYPSASETLQESSILIPLGGGKDSLVTLETLKKFLQSSQDDPVFKNQTISFFALNPIKATQEILTLNKDIQSITASRTIDPQLLSLNKKGYLNGHTPFNAYAAFLTTFVADLFGIKYVAVSNEASANECNTTYKGHQINHQYSKSFEFEQKFRHYSQQYFQQKTPLYFSFLRPLNELQIANLFSKSCQSYFSIFLSCNVGSKQNKWCHTCPKCLFTFLMLFPFIDQKILVNQIFDSNLFENEDLIQTALDLILPDQTKPFECVGSYTESAVAFSLSIQKYHSSKKKLPIVLRKVSQFLPRHKENTDQQANKILTNWNSIHAVPSKWEKVLKKTVQTIEPVTDNTK